MTNCICASPKVSATGMCLNHDPPAWPSRAKEIDLGDIGPTRAVDADDEVEVQDEDMDKCIATYIACRNLLKELDGLWEARRKKLTDKQEELSGRIRVFMEKNKVTEGLKSKSGTAYLSTRWTASLADPDAFMNYVINSKRFELLDRRANAAAVKDHVTEQGRLPTGCNLNAIQTVGVRSPTKKRK